MDGGLGLQLASMRRAPMRAMIRRRIRPSRPYRMTATEPQTPKTASLDPADLIEKVAAAADREAFADLFAVFAPRVKSYVLGLGATGAAAEELAQETLLAVWRKAAYFDRTRAGAATWIFTIARNLRIDAARRERSALAYTVDLTDEPDEPRRPDAIVSEGERSQRVRKAIESLSPEQIEVVRMAFFQEKAHSEIAQELGIPLGTVKSRVRLAMSRLRERLEPLL